MWTITFTVFLLLVCQTSTEYVTISPNAKGCTEVQEECFLLSKLCTSNAENCLQLSSNTTLIFMSGVHMLRSVIVLRDINDLTLTFHEKSQLHCDNRSGIVFINVTNLQINSLTMTNCGAVISEKLANESLSVQTETILKIQNGLKAAIFAVNIKNFHLNYSMINGSHGYGFLGINIIGDSFVTDTLVNSSNRNSLTDYCRNPRLRRSQAVECQGGNALFLYNDFPGCPGTRESHSLMVVNSTFSNGVHLTETYNDYVSQGCGLGIVATQIYYDMHLEIVNSTFKHNVAKSFGSNLFIRLIFSETNSFVSIRDSHILFGRCSYCNIPRGVPYSTLVFIYGLRVPSSRNRYKRCSSVDTIETKAISHVEVPSRQVLLIANSKFNGNIGGTIYAILFSGLSHTRNYIIVIRNCTLSKNQATKSPALYIADVSPRPENTKELEVIVESTTLDKHVTLTKPYTDTQPNTNLLLSIKSFTFRDCTFTDNDATAIMAHDTSLYFEGQNIFENNKARIGAAIQLTGISIIYLRPNTHMIFENNTALERGGAIYLTRGSEESYFFDCQIQVWDPTFTNISKLNITMEFMNNSAIEAGDAFYGGQIDACYTAAPSQFLYNRTFTRSATFDTITDFRDQPPSMSLVSSDAIKICFCFAGNHNCSIKRQTFSKYPGEEFEISVVGVGQRDGTVPTVVLAFSRMHKFRNSSQQTGRSCTNTIYRVHSNSSINIENIFLTPSNAKFNYPSLLQVTVNLLECSTLTGFVHDSKKQVCTCVSALKERNITCDIDTRIITRQPPYWLSNYSNHLLLHDNCPYDYCKPGQVQIVMIEPNISEQCAFNRSGTLCGSCREGFSQVFGSSRCHKCSNKYLSLLFLFALAGVVLVIFLFALNLTVSLGTINGLIFYANIVKVNETVFFPPGDRGVFRVFISWLNLDLGVETCLYDGMDSLVKVSLQFVFPFYLWAIVGLIILAFRHSTQLVKIVRLCGNHSVSVLATIFLLSFTKLQRTIKVALSFTTLEYPEGQRAIWLYDGNIPYAKKGHLALLFFSILFLVFICFPYALLIFSVQFLRRYSGRWYLRWVNTLMPIFDAYLGPYKPKQGYWTGLLLFVRVILVAVPVINIFGNPAVDIFVVSVVSLLLILINLGQGGVYKQIALTVLEISYIVNLGLLAASTALVRQINGKQRVAVIYTSCAAALVTLIATLVYHAKLQAVKWYGQWKKYRLSQKKKVALLEKSNDYEVFENIVVESDSHGNTKSTLVTTTVIDGFEREDSF